MGLGTGFVGGAGCPWLPLCTRSLHYALDALDALGDRCALDALDALDARLEWLVRKKLPYCVFADPLVAQITSASIKRFLPRAPQFALSLSKHHIPTFCRRRRKTLILSQI